MRPTGTDYTQNCVLLPKDRNLHTPSSNWTEHAALAIRVHRARPRGGRVDSGAMTASSVAAGTLPTLNLALTKSTVTVSCSEVSGAVNIVGTVSGEASDSPALILLKPGVTVAQFGQVVSHLGKDTPLDAIEPYATIVFDGYATEGAPSSAEAVLPAGNYVAVNNGNGFAPVHGCTVIRAGDAADAGRDRQRDRLRVPWRRHAPRRRAGSLPERGLPDPHDPVRTDEECGRRQEGRGAAAVGKPQRSREAVREGSQGDVRRPAFERIDAAGGDHGTARSIRDPVRDER
jgi:hypothetical protein